MNSRSAGDDASVEQGFQAWLKKHGIADADSPQRTWNYRGAFLAGVDPDKHGQLPDVFRVDNVELGLDQSAGIYRPIGWRLGRGPTDPAYSNPSNYAQMELGYDPASKIYRPLGSVKGETNEERRERELENGKAIRLKSKSGATVSESELAYLKNKGSR